VHKLESQMPTKDLQKRVAQLQKDMEERKRSAEAIRTETKRARLNSDNGGGGVGGGAVAGSLFPKTTPSSAFALPNSSSLLPKTTPPSTFAFSNSSSLLPTKPTHPSAFAPSNFSDLQRPAPMASIPSYNLPGQGVYDRGSQDIYRSAYDVGKNPSSLSRSQLYPPESLQSSLYGAGSYHGSTNYGSYNIGSGVPPATSYQSSYLR